MTTCKALIVDDSRTIRMVLRRYVTECGFEAYEAADGLDALHAIDLQRGNIQLVIADWNMPNMNGLELVQEMRRRPELAQTKILMVTTEAEMSHLASALSAGADEYVMKPFTRDALLQKLELLGMLSLTSEQEN